MAISMQRNLVPKSFLLRGSVRPWHIVFIALVAASVSGVASFYITKGESAEFRPIGRELVRHLLASAVILAFVVVVPELRRCLAALFARPLVPVNRADMTLAFGLMLCWGYGLYRFAFCLPLVLAYPEAYTIAFRESLESFKVRNLLFLFGIVITAPIAEELMFRGYLMNLWTARWGIWAGVLASSVVFGLFHWERAVFAAPLGFILALIYLRFDSLWPGIALHAAYNLLSFPWLVGGFFYVKQKAAFAQLETWSVEIILSLLFIPFAISFWRRFAPRA